MKNLVIVGYVIRGIVQSMTKTCNFLRNLTELSTFKSEEVPSLEDLHLPESGPNSPIPYSSIVTKNQFFQAPTYYILLDSEFNADETLQKNNWLKKNPKSVILKNK